MMNTNKQSIKFTTEFGPYAWHLEDQYYSYKKCIYVTKPYYEALIKKLAKHTSKLYNLALSTLPLEVLKYVPKHTASTLLNAINYGVFEVDGQKKNFNDFFYYCWNIMIGIDTFIFKH